MNTNDPELTSYKWVLSRSSRDQLDVDPAGVWNYYIRRTQPASWMRVWWKVAEGNNKKELYALRVLIASVEGIDLDGDEK